MATEVLEHCPAPHLVLSEIFRLLKLDGFFFFTVPFFWPIYDVFNDEYRYTNFALARLLRDTGFVDICMKSFGGWDARMFGLWLKRRPTGKGQGRLFRLAIFALLIMAIYSALIQTHKPPHILYESP
jgi:SAM-dependent methyltransferase